MVCNWIPLLLLTPKYSFASCLWQLNSTHTRTSSMPVGRIFRTLSAYRRRGASRIKTVLFPRRKHPRVYFATDVRVEGHDVMFTAHSVQLGSQGMCLERADQLSLAQPVLLAFALPGGYPVRLGAVVWWKKNGLVGLRFDPRDENRHIEDWIRRSAVTLHCQNPGETPKP